MNAWINYVGIGSIALSALACGSKGSDDGGEEAGAGGTSGTGGSSTGGSSGSGTGGTGGGTLLPVMTTMSFTSPSDVCPTPTAPNMAGCWRLVDSSSDPASTPIATTDIIFQHTTDDGDPEAGAFEATIPYTMASQWVSFGINFDAQDLSNRAISARVKVASGLGDPTELMTAPGGTKVYAKSGMGYCYANGEYFNQGDAPHPIGTWNTIQFNLLRTPGYEDPNCTVGFDPADIREIGVQFDSSSMSTTAETAVVLIDTITY